MRGLGDVSGSDKDIWPLVLAASNKDLKMFKYFWDQHYLWDISHLHAVLEVIFINTSWKDALKYLFTSTTTEDIIFAMTYGEREAFVQEMFRRYIGHSTDKLAQDFFEVLLVTPFTHIGLKGVFESCALNPHLNEVQKIWHTKFDQAMYFKHQYL